VTDGDTGRPDAGKIDAEKADAEPADVDVTGAVEGGDEGVPSAEPEPEWVRRRRLDAAFGDGAHSESLGDRWYRDQVPPHHG
jgi:hypothetical protein